jgi:PAS domain S-box-containing protein
MVRQAVQVKMAYRSRFQSGLILLTGLFVLGTVFVVLLYGAVPSTPKTRAPLMLAALTAILIGLLVCILFVLRWLFRPYRQLVGEAERAPITKNVQKSRDEAEFVLETFQTVVAQLQDQRNELKKLSAQASERADSAEKFSERIVASVPSGLIAFDGNGHSVALNGPGRQLLGFDGKAMGQPYRNLLEGYPHLAEMVEQCLETGTLYRREEVEAVTPNGHLRRLGATVAPIDLSTERGSRGALCLLTDITEVTQLREQVALKKNLESLGEMSAGLAHEFKNTIAALHGYAQLMQSLALDEKGRVAADSLLNEVRNLSEMVTSFLNFARPQPLDLEPVSLRELLNECATEMKGLFESSKVELAMKLPADETDALEIRADERMLRQALLNLFRNAAEAIPDDKSERRVEVRASRDHNGIVVEIEDSGEGIPVAELQKIFIPFFTTKSTGHGVGLALAHRVVTEHSGTLTAGNSSKGGAVFTLRLPA